MLENSIQFDHHNQDAGQQSLKGNERRSLSPPHTIWLCGEQPLQLCQMISNEPLDASGHCGHPECRKEASSQRSDSSSSCSSADRRRTLRRRSTLQVSSSSPNTRKSRSLWESRKCLVRETHRVSLWNDLPRVGTSFAMAPQPPNR